ncbi:MAG TPA: Rv3654c family TadE-like protein [Micromonospora sp.]|nr:Rv3654c family TadE-like protein [Micromonospora sp.]
MTRRVCRAVRAGAGRDRGSASLWLLAVGLLLVAAGLAGAAEGAARVARHQARVAADFGALAGAARWVDGPEAACARAAELVRANRGRLTSCALDGLDLQITVEVRVAPLPGLTRLASATARAGPVRG